MPIKLGAVANPKNVRTQGLWALQRGGLWATKSLGWIFGPPFLWFISFGGAKEMNDNYYIYILVPNRK
jgi:hypothetical protein